MTQLGQNFSQEFNQDAVAFRTETDGIGTKNSQRCLLWYACAAVGLWQGQALDSCVPGTEPISAGKCRCHVSDSAVVCVKIRHAFLHETSKWMRLALRLL